MEEAIDAWEGEGGLRRRGSQYLSVSANGEKVMAEKINTAIPLTVAGAFLPESPRFEGEPCSKGGGRLVQDLDRCGLDRRIPKRDGPLFIPLPGLEPCGRFFSIWWPWWHSLRRRPDAQSQSWKPSLPAWRKPGLKTDARLRPYIVTRDYKLFGKERDKTKSQVIADITFVPPDFKRYAIQQTSGTGIGERIVRRMLEREAEVVKDYASTDISPDNYDFRFIREEEVSGQRCYLLELVPRRKDKNLLRGNIWVDADTYLLHRTEAEPAKRPSWWLRDVRMVFLYGDVGGMWLQTALEATATVRLLGPYRMVSRDLKYEISELVAAGSSATSFRSICPTPCDPGLSK